MRSVHLFECVYVALLSIRHFRRNGTFVTQVFNSLISSDCKHAMIHIKWFEILFRKVFHHWHRRVELTSALHCTDLSDLFSTLSYIFAFRENCFEVAPSFGFRKIFFYSFFFTSKGHHLNYRVVLQKKMEHEEWKHRFHLIFNVFVQIENNYKVNELKRTKLRTWNVWFHSMVIATRNLCHSFILCALSRFPGNFSECVLSWESENVQVEKQHAGEEKKNKMKENFLCALIILSWIFIRFFV